MDFFSINTKEGKEGVVEVYPDFKVGRSKDLMVKGRSFFAVWDEAEGLWSTDEYKVQDLVDDALQKYADEHQGPVRVRYLKDFSSEKWAQFRRYLNNISDNSHPLDETLVFSNTETKKSDFATKKLPYPLESGDHSSWDTILDTLYAPEEKAKIEWAIGAIVSGDSKKIQKFLVFYGPPGTGKSTVLNIIQKLFEGYFVTFDARALGSTSNAFATEVFKTNPLVAIQHDGDLSKIEDNTRMNSIISHEEMVVNEKFKPSYTARFNAFLLMGTNKPVKISDAKSGLIRRLIEVQPTGKKLSAQEYNSCMSRIDFELGAIAKHCLDVYLAMGKHYYDDYRPTEMMYRTDPMLNFVSDHVDIFKSQEYTTVKSAYSLYKEFCADSGIDKPMQRQRFQSELGNYFNEFHERIKVGGTTIRSAFSDFDMGKVQPTTFEKDKTPVLELNETESAFDRDYADLPAQYAKEDGTPEKRWANVKTTLEDISTGDLHYVQVPENHIVIDFDIPGEDGEKDLGKNLEAASLWPATYAEVSKSGQGIHLHYIYDGDVSQLSSLYDEHIEVKVYRGDSSLRRKLTRCSNTPIATINSGLPLKEKKVISEKTIQSEKGLRNLIIRNLRKEIHPGTKPSVDFIKKILDEAYESDISYDVTDLRSAILTFAQRSTNQSLASIKMVQQMKFKSDDDKALDISKEDAPEPKKDAPLVFFDIEVYPNLLLVCWKYQGQSDIVKMINPAPNEIENLLKMKLVGFNNRRYDNHILYARYMGYDNEAIYNLSQRIVGNDRNATFGEAYGLSYTDIYDFSSKKQGLKKFQIELGIDHVEMEIPWDKPVSDDQLPLVIKYCENDVISTEKVFEARKGDYTARLILAELSGLTPNHTTQNHTAKIIFEGDRNAQKQFVYTDLSEEFPGYGFDPTAKTGKSSYRGEDPSEGGYVYAEPGIYNDVAVLDIASMHPASIEALNLFGKYTSNFTDLRDARIAIKRGEYDDARKMLDGKLKPYLEDESDAADLSYALKIVINIVYGLTSAKFPNPFRDERNKDNIVAKRGALFMIDLKNEVQKRGFTVAHIKTDSIKIPNATEDIIEFVMEFGKKYGYDFEHEETMDKFCLVNDAVYVARTGDEWEAVGAQFQHPYVFKTLFSREPVEFNDFCETKNVSKGAMYLDTNPDKAAALAEEMRFVGKTGRFVPVKAEYNGGVLYRVKDDKNYSVSGTKGYLWLEAALAEQYGLDAVDRTYAEYLVDEALSNISKFGTYEELVSRE